MAGRVTTTPRTGEPASTTDAGSPARTRAGSPARPLRILVGVVGLAVTAWAVCTVFLAFAWYPQAFGGSDILIGLLRLRKCSDEGTFRPELVRKEGSVGGTSIVRELHVYGTAVPVHGRDPTKFQHQVRCVPWRPSSPPSVVYTILFCFPLLPW